MSTSLSDANVLSSDYGDGSADFTVSFADDNYKFSAVARENEAVVQYEETLSWRGQIRVSEPDDTVFKTLMVSEEMTTFLEDNSLDSVRRKS